MAGNANWQARRLALLEEYMVEFRALRHEFHEIVVATDARLNEWEMTLQQAITIASTPPPEPPSTMGKIVEFRRKNIAA